MRILHVARSPSDRMAVKMSVPSREIKVVQVSDQVAGRLALLNNTYAAILLELDGVGHSVFPLLQHLRQRYDSTPVLVLSAVDQVDERIAAFDAGVDDYLVRPFAMAEVWARTRALVRRYQKSVISVVAHRGVQLDRTSRRVTKGGVEVKVTRYKFLLLEGLLTRPSRASTVDELMEIVYGRGDRLKSNTIAVIVHNLRRKLGVDMIRTVHGMGYMAGPVQHTGPPRLDAYLMV